MKSLGTVLLGTRLLLSDKVIMLNLGTDLYRLGSWFRLFTRGGFMLPNAPIERFYVEIIAHVFLVPVIFFPLYVSFGATFIILAFAAGKTEGAIESKSELLLVCKM